MSIGIPSELYFHSDPVELRLLVGEFQERRKEELEAHRLNAGVVAAMLYNINRKKGARPMKASDFLPKAKKRRLTAKEAYAVMHQWASDRNRAIGAPPPRKVER